MAESAVPSSPPPLPGGASPLQPQGCQLCNASELSPRSQLGVCEPCRRKLVRRALPVWIKAVAVLVALMVLVAFTRFPEAIDASVRFTRAKERERQRLYGVALGEFEALSARYPNCDELTVRVAATALRAGDLPKAARALRSLEGHQLNRQLMIEAEDLISKLAPAPDRSRSVPRR